VITQFVNVTTPALVLGEHPDSVPGPPEVGVPVLMASVTEDVNVDAVLSKASRAATIGWVGIAWPVDDALGDCVKISFAATPAATVRFVVPRWLPPVSVPTNWTASALTSVIEAAFPPEATPFENVTRDPDEQPVAAGYVGVAPLGELAGPVKVMHLLPVYPVSTALAAFRAVRATVKAVPATGEDVLGARSKWSTAAVNTVVAGLAVLVFDHELATTVT
jgi:hypothetical protein